MRRSEKPKDVPLRKVSDCETIDLPERREVDLGIQKFLDAFWREIYRAFVPRKKQ